MLLLAISFDLAVEYDNWLGLSYAAKGFRVLSLILVLFPLALWASMLSCLMKWNINREIELLKSYELSIRHCCLGPLMSFGLLIFLWFSCRELVWSPLAWHQNSEQQVLLVPLNQGRALLDRDERANISNVWVEHQGGDAQYQSLLYLEELGWRLKEDHRMNNAKLKAELENKFTESFSDPSLLKLAFGDAFRMSLSELMKSDHARVNGYLFAVRFGLPVMTMVLMMISFSGIFFLSGKRLWLSWASCFLFFVIAVSVIQRVFIV